MKISERTSGQSVLALREQVGVAAPDCLTLGEPGLIVDLDLPRYQPMASRVGIVAAVAGKPGLLGDAEPEDGDGARLRAAYRFQVDPG
jgi:hypothetical protein